MDAQRRVAMASDIASHFASQSDREAGIAGVANHPRKFRDPRMRPQVITHLDAGGSGLSDLARAGIERLQTA
jgi:formate dehydrogenase subunit delta